jgi:oligopeptide/dipeptide ABC transporter ATP-binding protein
MLRGAAEWVTQHAPYDLDARPGFISRAGRSVAAPRLRGKPARPSMFRHAPHPPGGIADTADAIRRGRTSASETVERAFARIHALDTRLRAFVVTLDARARREAEILDTEARAGHFRGRLHGVPVSIKDVIHVVLDEPTSALDVSVQAVILRLLADLRDRLAMTYLFVSHDLNLVRLFSDRVIVMYLGQVAEIGPADRLFDEPQPYTRALLSAVPMPDPSARRQRIPLTGEPRSPVDPLPHVCRFYGRCPEGFDRCEREMPLLRAVGDAHQAACHRVTTRAAVETTQRASAQSTTVGT